MASAQRVIVRQEPTLAPEAVVPAQSEATSSGRTWPRLADLASVAVEPALPRCITLTEGAAGMVSQVTGLANAIGYPHAHHKVVMRWPFSTLWPGFLPGWDGVFSDRTFLDPESPPQIAISCGRLGIAASLALKRHYGRSLFTIHIQDPKLPAHWFDLIVAPAHDGLSGPNVVQSLGAVHHLTADRIKAAAAEGPTDAMQMLTAPFIGVILGGPNRYYGYSAADIDRLVAQLQAVIQSDGVQLAIIPSRRTPESILQKFRETFGQDQFVWDGTGQNPYIPVLALATHLIVTGDSVSMISEAAATCKPIYVAQLTEKRVARRFRHFHQSFNHAGITRVFEGRLESWTYNSPDRTGLIATLIREHLRR